MDKRTDLELVVLSKSDDEKVSADARYALWDRYQFFIKKKYFQWLATFSRNNVEFEDYLQDAYIAFVHALDLCDVERMKEHNASNFSTVLYFQLMKIKNRHDIDFQRYGHIYNYSELASDVDCIDPEEKFSGSNTLAGQWIAATTIDNEVEIKKYMYETLVEEYCKTLDKIDRKIYQLLIERQKFASIVQVLPEFTEVEIRKKISTIRSGLRNYIEANSYV